MAGCLQEVVLPPLVIVGCMLDLLVDMDVVSNVLWPDVLWHLPVGFEPGYILAMGRPCKMIRVRSTPYS